MQESESIVFIIDDDPLYRASTEHHAKDASGSLAELVRMAELPGIADREL